MFGRSIPRARRPARLVAGVGVALSLSVSGLWAATPWVSRVAPEAQGEVRQASDGRRIQLRHPGWADDDFSAYPTHRYTDQRRHQPPMKVGLPALAGDVARGKAVWLKAPCVNCHVNPDDERWAGTLGPGLSGYGDRAASPARTYQIIYDARIVFPNTMMPPWGTAGLLSAEDIAHLTAYLHSLRQQAAPTDPQWNPATRTKPEYYFGDNLDPTRNPAVIPAEEAITQWRSKGPRGAACADCHGADPQVSMRGVAVTYPKFSKKYDRVISLEDWLSAHAPERTGLELPVDSAANLAMAMLVKMASNGLPVALALSEPATQAALARGKQTFYKRVGQRQHACADCHAPEQVNGKWLGGRYIARAAADVGLTRGYPAWRTSFGEIWSLRKRVQWCMLPHGANNLSADAAEYAELELYLASFDQGKPMSVPGLKD